MNHCDGLSDTMPQHAIIIQQPSQTFVMDYWTEQSVCTLLYTGIPWNNPDKPAVKKNHGGALLQPNFLAVCKHMNTDMNTYHQESGLPHA